jgi:hypothetical protein
VADDTLVGAPATLQDAVWLEGMALCLSCGEVLIGEGLGCSDVSDCLEWSVDGVALDADHCIDTTIPGIHTLELTPVACAADPGFVDDIRAFEVVSAADVSAEIDQWPEDWAQAWEGSLELTGGGFDTAWFHPDGVAPNRPRNYHTGCRLRRARGGL